MVFGNYDGWRKAKVIRPTYNDIFPGIKQGLGLFVVYCIGGFFSLF